MVVVSWATDEGESDSQIDVAESNDESTESASSNKTGPTRKKVRGRPKKNAV
jgi:hypothetical protein